MSQKWALAPVLLGILLAGCFTSASKRSTAWFEKVRPFHGPSGGDVVIIDLALLERPVGDRYINEELWERADEQVIAVERRAVMEENGFRIGQIGGITPEGLQNLLLSDRSCINPRRLQLHAGHSTKVNLGPVAAPCVFTLHEEGQVRPISLDQAQCTLVVVPSLTRDGRTRLQFTPQIQYGDKTLLPRPAADRSGWELRQQQPTESYSGLSWEVVVAPNEYVLVGGRYDRPETLGHQSFIRRDSTQPVQRLLALRTGRPVEPVAGPQAEAPFSRSPPLASQASATAVRGSRQ